MLHNIGSRQNINPHLRFKLSALITMSFADLRMTHDYFHWSAAITPWNKFKQIQVQTKKSLGSFRLRIFDSSLLKNLRAPVAARPHVSIHQGPLLTPSVLHICMPLTALKRAQGDVHRYSKWYTWKTDTVQHFLPFCAMVPASFPNGAASGHWRP